MKIIINQRKIGALIFCAAVGIGAGCQGKSGGNGGNAGNQNTIVNSVSNSLKTANSANTNAVSSVSIDAKEPDQYQATVKIQFQATGNQQTTQLPALSANVAKNATDRMMDLTLPNGEKIIYLDKNGTSYAILPNRKQYAELDKETLGVDVRRLMMPDQIVAQVKNLKGFNLVGEENVNGRQAVKYSYQATADTQTQVKEVKTESFVLIDKETGLPLHSETVSQSGANVQSFSGLRISTDMTDIKPIADAALFNIPTDFQKVDSQQVKEQADVIFRIAGTFFAQMLQQNQANAANAANSATPANSPAK